MPKLISSDAGKISVLNPIDGAVFPPEFIAPTFIARQTVSGTTDYGTNTSAVIENAGGTDFATVNLASLGATGSVLTVAVSNVVLAENTAVQFFTTVGNPATGNKSLRFIIEYRIIDFSETV